MLTFLDNDSTACWYQTGGCASVTSSIPEYGYSNIRVVPNPATTEIIVDGLKNDATITLGDLLGKIILNKKVDSTQNSDVRINVQHLDPGLFLLKTSTDDTTITQMILITRQHFRFFSI